MLDGQSERRKLGEPELRHDVRVLGAKTSIVFPRPPCGTSEIDQTTLGDHRPVLHLLGDQDFSNFRSSIHGQFSSVFGPKLRVRKSEQASIFPVFAANRSPSLSASAISGYFAIRRRQLRRARAPARGPATIGACSILGNRKQRATGSFTSRERSSRYSLSGGCFGCSYSEWRSKPLRHGQRAQSRYFNSSNAEVALRSCDTPSSGVKAGL